MTKIVEGSVLVNWRNGVSITKINPKHELIKKRG